MTPPPSLMMLHITMQWIPSSQQPWFHQIHILHIKVCWLVMGCSEIRLLPHESFLVPVWQCFLHWNLFTVTKKALKHPLTTIYLCLIWFGLALNDSAAVLLSVTVLWTQHPIRRATFKCVKEVVTAHSRLQTLTYLTGKLWNRPLFDEKMKSISEKAALSSLSVLLCRLMSKIRKSVLIRNWSNRASRI